MLVLIFITFNVYVQGFYISFTIDEVLPSLKRANVLYNRTLLTLAEPKAKYTLKGSATQKKESHLRF